MREHDALTDLARAVEAPITPDPAFADQLKSRLLRSLDEPESLTVAEVAPLANGHRQTDRNVRLFGPGSTWLRIAAVLVIAIGIIAATGSFRQQNEMPTMIPAVQSQATLNAAAVSEVAPAWRALLSGEPNRTTQSGWYLTETLAIGESNVFRLVWTTEFEGVIAYNATDGAEQWRQAFTHRGSGVAIAGEGLVVVMVLPSTPGSVLDGRIAAFDQQTGDERWRTTTDITAYDFALADGRLFLSDNFGQLVALDASTGESAGRRLFTRSTQADDGARIHTGLAGKQLIITDDTIVLSAMGGLIVAVPIADFDTAPLLWSQELDASATTLAVSGDTLAALMWRVEDQTVDPSDQHLGVSAFDLATGELLWQTPEEATNAGPPKPIPGGFAFMYTLQPTAATAEAATPDDSSNAAVIHARDARTGEVLWTIEGYFAVHSTPDATALLVLGFDGDEGGVAVVSTADGALSPGFATRENPNSLKSTIDNHRVYTVDSDYALVAYELSAFFDD